MRKQKKIGRPKNEIKTKQYGVTIKEPVMQSLLKTKLKHVKFSDYVNMLIEQDKSNEND